MTQAISPTGHARLSPSASSRWMQCPSSIYMTELFPQEGSSHFAEEGTAAHELAALTLLSDGKLTDAFLGQASTEAKGFTFDDDMCGFVQKYVDNVIDYAQGNEMFVENRVNLSNVMGVENTFGTADIIILTADGTELMVQDLKYGRGVRVDAENNKQLMCYALGALEEYDPAGFVENVRLVIHQPRLGSVSEWEVSVQDLLVFGEELRKKASLAVEIADSMRGKDLKSASDKLNNNLNPSEDACRFCSAKNECMALTEHNLKIIIEDFEDLTAETNETLGAKIEESKEGLKLVENEQLGVLLSNIDLIEGWCKAVRTRAADELQNGKTVPGFKLVRGKQGNRQWANKQEAEEILKSMRIKRDEMYKQSLISPTDAEKLLAKDSPRRWNKLQGQITRSEGGVHVAPESDKRPALVIEAVEDQFTDLDNIEDLF